LAGVKFLLKKERVFFFRGSALHVFGQVAEQCGLGFAEAIFWGNGFRKTSTDFSDGHSDLGLARRRGLGRNAGGFFFLVWSEYHINF
jgi:hypothetical protein